MQFLLDDVGANLRVRPSRVVLSNRFIRGKQRFPISGAHTGAPLRRRGSMALLFTCMVNWSGLFCTETVQRTKAFPRGQCQQLKLYRFDGI